MEEPGRRRGVGVGDVELYSRAVLCERTLHLMRRSLHPLPLEQSERLLEGGDI